MAKHENLSFFRFLDDVDELGLMKQMADLQAQVKENAYDSADGESFYVVGEDESLRYCFYFVMGKEEDLDDSHYVVTEENDAVIHYLHHQVYEVEGR